MFSNRTWAAVLVALAVGAVIGVGLLVWGITAGVVWAASYVGPILDRLSS